MKNLPRIGITETGLVLGGCGCCSTYAEPAHVLLDLFGEDFEEGSTYIRLTPEVLAQAITDAREILAHLEGLAR